MRFKNLDWLENCKSYILVNLLTTLGALPFAIGGGGRNHFAKRFALAFCLYFGRLLFRACAFRDD